MPGAANNGSQLYSLQNLTIIYAPKQTVECGFLLSGDCDYSTCAGFGYPFKFFNYHRHQPVDTPFGPNGPLEVVDDPNGPPTTIWPQTTTSSSPTGSPTSPPTATHTGNGTGIGTGTDAVKNGGGLSNAVVAGIGAGGATLVIIIGVLAFLLFQRHRKSQVAAAAAPTTAGSSSPGLKAELEDNPKAHSGSELDSTCIKAGKNGNELDGTCVKPETNGNELDGTGIKPEEKKEKPQVSELGVQEQRPKVEGCKCQHTTSTFELA